MAIARAFACMGFPSSIRVARDGREGLGALRDAEGCGPEATRIVLLDINMPRLNGLGFLEELRADESLRNTVCFVLTTSDDERDRSAAYDLGIAGYIVKQKAGRDFTGLIKLLESYCEVVELPPK